MNLLTTDECIALIEAHNNTHAWDGGDGWIYIDSMKYPRVFRQLAADQDWRFEMVHEVADRTENLDILMGCRSTGLVVAGRSTHCHVMRVRVTE